MNLKEFVVEKLEMPYINYYYRLKANALRLEDYHRICFYTGRSFEELFPNPLKREPLNTLDLAIKTLPLPLSPPSESPTLETIGEAAAKPLKKEVLPARKEEVKSLPSKAFVFIDPFAEVGIPQSDFE